MPYRDAPALTSRPAVPPAPDRRRSDGPGLWGDVDAARARHQTRPPGGNVPDPGRPAASARAPSSAATHRIGAGFFSCRGKNLSVVNNPGASLIVAFRSRRRMMQVSEQSAPRVPCRAKPPSLQVVGGRFRQVRWRGCIAAKSEPPKTPLDSKGVPSHFAGQNKAPHTPCWIKRSLKTVPIRSVELGYDHLSH